MKEEKDIEMKSFNEVLFDNDLSIEELEERLEMSPWICGIHCEQEGGGCNPDCRNCQGNSDVP